MEKRHLLAVFAELAKEDLPDGLLVDDVVVRVRLQRRRQVDAFRHVGERQQLLPFFAATREINGRNCHKKSMGNCHTEFVGIVTGGESVLEQ